MHREIKLTRAHCIKECRKWQTILNELRTRNVQLKELLSHAIHGDVSSSFIEQAEFFQQKFVEKDQILDLLRYDVKTVSDKLSEHPIPGTIERQYATLKKDMVKLRAEFHHMETSFTQFVASNGNK